jgi:formylglycine-generating enzyme required for sulfatase activity
MRVGDVIDKKDQLDREQGEAGFPQRVSRLPVEVELLLPREVKAKLVPLEPVTFIMGSPRSEVGRYPDEVQHPVTLTEPFLFWSTPVTQAQFEAVMGFNPSSFRTSGPDAPAEGVTWFEALAFCNELSRQQGLAEAYLLREVQGKPGDEDFYAQVEWRGQSCAGYSLPTEAQWEYAARAGSKTATPKGDLAKGLINKESPNPVLDPIAWFSGNSQGRTHPVGVREPNAWGLFDTIGNVYEWVWDRRGSYGTGPATDPIGSESGWDRIIRGGSWESLGRSCRLAYRGFHAPDVHIHSIGFRPARPLTGG